MEEKIEEKVEETVAEVKSPRGRPKQRRSLVDWAWENVEGKAERTTRDRRSLSRERAPAQPVGQIVEVKTIKVFSDAYLMKISPNQRRSQKSSKL